MSVLDVVAAREAAIKQPVTSAHSTTHVVSYSELDSIRQCRLKAHLAYKERWQPETVSAALSRGKLYHAVLEAHYRTQATTLDGSGVEQTVDPWDVLNAAKDCEETDTVRWIYEGYLERYGKDTQWEVLQVEQRVEEWLTLPNGRRSTFKLKGFVDLLVRDHSAGGGLWIVDHKLEPLSSELHTPYGLKHMGDIQAGDEVLGSDGTPTRVVNVFPQGLQEIWNVHFDDGAVVPCGPEHLWSVGREGMESPRTISTQKLRENLDGSSRYVFVPIGNPLYQHTQNLPINPYTLGALLGDGGMTRSLSLHTHENEWEHFKRMWLCAGDEWGAITLRNEHGFNVHVNGGNTLRELERLGLRGCKFNSKFVPELYLNGNIEQRLALLQGLMDTDGCVSQGKSRFVTTSPALRDAVIRLARSLGGTAREWLIPDYQKTQSTPAWAVWVWTPLCHFLLPRKVEKWQTERSIQQRKGRRVVGVEPSGTAEAQCIQVEAADGLYVTGRQAVALTHNTCRELPKSRALDFDDQMGLYTLLLRRQGLDIRGAIYNACRSYKLKRPMSSDERFSRSLTTRTDTELEVMAQEALATFKSAYGVGQRAPKGGHSRGTLPPRSPDPDRCGWRCPFVEPCLMSRKGRDIRELLTEMDYSQNLVRH